ncbi:MAG: hypothetical protein K9K66_16660 [Desulfarculaceae bacterium]|nr:hypothetical protein [Desulfarculaceae bacterium]MCF8074118.1 hypothetical protein [Desulfarculaceae bacterium]MCF8103290.1 hypothetical protein [Desulfarculaceae bacterium]MCF8116852.1 hypothetical protein [Desulfarculaceae bacterium]
MRHSGLLLCAPEPGLSCFGCCPPIRPAGYDHADHEPSLRRLLADNTAAIREAGPPAKPMTGYWCPGLGFLDPAGKTVGCLLHPARHQGRDLRGPTGYQEKCARESCPPSRAFAALGGESRDRLAALCQGMDSFAYSSPKRNPVMRLLSFGPEVAATAAGLGLASRDELMAWDWLAEADPALGWLLARRLGEWGAEALAASGLAGRLAREAEALAKRLGPPPPLEQGELLGGLCGEWEARTWRGLLGRQRARQAELARWRELADSGSA